MTSDAKSLGGLTSAEARQRQKHYGKNELVPQEKPSFFKKILHVVQEPMFLLLIAAALIYFLFGELTDGIFMLVFVAGIIAIEIVQEWKTDRTLSALRDLSSPHVRVIRDGREGKIASVDLVPGDLLLLHEGMKIPADGSIVKCSDLCVDESSLTGESAGVWKVSAEESGPSSDHWKRDYCYAGTLVTQGSAAVLVDKIGAATEYGKIGAHVAAAPDRPTPLEKQTRVLVKYSAWMAAFLFVLVAAITYLNIPEHAFIERVVESLLSGITLSMAMIPEEFPVILTVFLSMGAWRLARKNSLVRRLPAVETLGAVSVLCVDKTGTITMNSMEVRETWAADGDEHHLWEIMGLGCETDAYDPMERAMLVHCEKSGITREHLLSGEMLAEYAFTNELKMMGHVWRHDGEIMIAAKGSPEKVISICDLSGEERREAEAKMEEMSDSGLRVIAIGVMKLKSEKDIPEKLTDCRLRLLGMVGLADPPRKGVGDDIAACVRAGIQVKMITGDNGKTASSIAKMVGMPDSDKVLEGEQLARMTDVELRGLVSETSVFSRVVPEHKMRIVKALKENGKVVAMTGDGVNDAPALKYADIGIAMGKRGSEVSREAADLVLMDDNFSTIVDTVRDGRRIYDNIRKAVVYIFAIHIPIAMASLLAPFLGIRPGDLLLLPLHVVLLELIIDPTCSIVLERQPAERNIMERAPRGNAEKLLNWRMVVKSVAQGAGMFIASFGTYYFMLEKNPGNAPLARTMGLAVLMLANLFLVLVNSSDYDPVYRTIRRLAGDWAMWAVIACTVGGLLVMLYSPLNEFFKLSPLSAGQFFAVLGVAFASVCWYELVKAAKKRFSR